MKNRIGISKKSLLAVFCAFGFVLAGNAVAKSKMCVDDCQFQQRLCQERCKGDNSCLKSCSIKLSSCINDCN